MEQLADSPRSLEGNPRVDTARRRKTLRALSPTAVAEMVKLYRTGATTYELAERFGCHRNTVSDRLKAEGLTLRTDVNDPMTRTRVQASYDRTGSLKDTARELGIDRGTVKKIIASS